MLLAAEHKIGDGRFVGLKVWSSLVPSAAALAFQAELTALALLPKLAALALAPVFPETLSVFSVQVQTIDYTGEDSQDENNEEHDSSGGHTRVFIITFLCHFSLLVCFILIFIIFTFSIGRLLIPSVFGSEPNKVITKLFLKLIDAARVVPDQSQPSELACLIDSALKAKERHFFWAVLDHGRAYSLLRSLAVGVCISVTGRVEVLH